MHSLDRDRWKFFPGTFRLGFFGLLRQHVIEFQQRVDGRVRHNFLQHALLEQAYQAEQGLAMYGIYAVE